MLPELLRILPTTHAVRLLLPTLFVLLLIWAFLRALSRKSIYTEPTGLLRGIKDLPGVPFKFPNGQGTEKFFNGRSAALKWRNKYGPIYSIWSGLKREIVITKPEHVQAFYKDSHTHIKAAENNSGWLFGELLGCCVGLVSQQQWRRVRKPFEPHFTRTMAIRRPRSFIYEAREFFENLNAGGKECIVNTTSDLKYCPFFMVASIFFGVSTPELRKSLYAIGPAREELFKDAFMGGINRYTIAKYFPGSAISRLRTFQKSWEAFVRQAHAHAILKGDGAIVSLWAAMESGDISMRELLQTLDESLFANLDVTAHAVSWNILRIAQHSNIQQRVREEIQMQVNSTNTEDVYEKYICSENTLLAACVLETSRLHPILPFSNPEAADKDKMIGDFMIPRNTDVIVDAYAINVYNPYWDNASRFDPYRHLGKKDQVMSPRFKACDVTDRQISKARRHNIWRFGFGPRQCLGKNIADIILRVIIAELLKCYQIRIIQNDMADGVELQAESWIGLPDGRVLMTPLSNDK